MGSGYKRQFRRERYDKNPFCPQCGVKMILPEDLPKRKKNSNMPAYYPDNMCTYEHIHSKLNENRGKVSCCNKVLCNKCNHEFGEIEYCNLGIEAIRERIDILPALKPRGFWL